MKVLALVMALVMATLAYDAQAAKRLGGGMSLGKQSSNVKQREATPPAASPTQNSTAGNTATAAKPAAPAAAPSRPWGAMLGGLAAGLGLAWLANSLGFGEELAQVMLFALLAMVALGVLGWFMRRRQAPQASPYAFEGAGRAAPVPQAPARAYRPENVGNDASARPWERNSMAFEAPASAAGGSLIGADLRQLSTWGIPADFDANGFLSAARANFVTLQAAWDRSDTAQLRTLMTDAMFTEIRQQLQEREGHLGGQPNKTEVVMLDAHLLGIEDMGAEYMASVEFSGMIREEPATSPSPFREVWNMTKPKDGSVGWLVAGVQALQ